MKSTRARIAAIVFADAGRHLIIGLACGLVAAWAVSGLFSSVLYGVRPTEPVLYLIVIALLIVVAAAAVWMPARRAAHVDPVVALRE